MNPLSLQISGISKTFASKTLFHDFSCDFPLGSTAIVGPNGIGKTTLLSILVGAISCDKGSIKLNGIDLEKQSVKAKRQLGYLPDVTMAYPFITGHEFINFICAVKKAKLTDALKQLISEFSLEKYWNMQFRDMSLGTQKKFMAIAALLGDPSILILDEPTNALEQASRHVLINYLNMHKTSKIIVFSTHDEQLIAELNPHKLILEMNPVTGLKTISQK